MKITILGIGAMGSLFAAYLHPLADVTLFGHWPEQLAAIRQSGLRLEEANGRTTHHPLRVTNNPAEITATDLALILVKSHQTGQAAHTAQQILAAGGLALTLQNGLGNLETLTAVLGPQHTAIGITSAGATLVKAGHILAAGLGHTYLAATEPLQQADRLFEVAALFRIAGFPTELTDHPESLIWGKLAVSAGINPLSALLGVPNGYLAEHPIARAIMGEAANEVAALAQSLGIPLPYADAAQRALEVAQNTAVNHSSMLQDVRRGAPTEIEAICGAVVAYGREQHIPTPVNQVLWRELRKIESGKQKERLTPEATLSYLQSLITEEKELA
jgi:2-dehydropantoate 2-reductase